VTPELQRSYEQKLLSSLEQYEKRIDWLSRGSRQLFGTVTENNICILIDTSQSMQMSLEYVKKKLQSLLQVKKKQQQQQ
jgi:von Willebrand factor A domain-containing protein 3